MNKNLFTAFVIFTFAVLISCTSSSYAQNVRMLSLGGIKYGLNDEDNSLNPYDFGSNPAWMINDEKEMWLKITPSYDKNWGDYKRLYDFGANDVEALSFQSLKPLGENGTFLGKASYSFEERKNVFRSLEYNAYNGKAFLITDTTKGNFRYDGPKVGFSYSFELLGRLFAGVEANYQLMDGLKNRYSEAKTLYRDVDGKMGLAYQFSDNLVLGLDFGLISSQVSFDMKDVLGQNVIEINNYRGDLYSTSIRKETVDQKIRMQAEQIDLQIYFRPFDDLETALKADYQLSGTKVLLPRGTIKEFEEGFANLENYDFEFRSKYHMTSEITLGASIRHNMDLSWSKNSERNLLLWKWDVHRTTLGLGASYDLKSLGLLLGFDYEALAFKSDSSKYIDNRFLSLSTLNHLIRLGAEYKLSDNLSVRAGYNYGFDKIDLTFGGSNVRQNYSSLGFSLNMMNSAAVDAMAQYGSEAPLGYMHYSRNHLSFLVTVRLNTF